MYGYLAPLHKEFWGASVFPLPTGVVSATGLVAMDKSGYRLPGSEISQLFFGSGFFFWCFFIFLFSIFQTLTEGANTTP